MSARTGDLAGPSRNLRDRPTNPRPFLSLCHPRTPGTHVRVSRAHLRARVGVVCVCVSIIATARRSISPSSGFPCATPSLSPRPRSCPTVRPDTLRDTHGYITLTCVDSPLICLSLIYSVGPIPLSPARRGTPLLVYIAFAGYPLISASMIPDIPSHLFPSQLIFGLIRGSRRSH